MSSRYMTQVAMYVFCNRPREGWAYEFGSKASDRPQSKTHNCQRINVHVVTGPILLGSQWVLEVGWQVGDEHLDGLFGFRKCARRPNARGHPPPGDALGSRVLRCIRRAEVWRLREIN